MKKRYKNYLQKSKLYDYFCYGINSKTNLIIERLKNNYLFYGCYCLNEKEKQEIREQKRQEKKEYQRKQEEEMAKTFWGQKLLQQRFYNSNYCNSYYTDKDITGINYIVK